MMDENVIVYVKGLADRMPPASGDLNAVMRRGRRRRVTARGTGLLAVGAATAVVIATLPQSVPPSGVAATSVPDQQDPAPGTTSPVTTMAVYDEEAGLCGSTFPIDLHVSDEYGDGVDGPATMASDADSQQMVRHWEGPETTLEVRWPADPDIWVTNPSVADDSATVYTTPPDDDGNVTDFTLPDDGTALDGSSPGGDPLSSIGGEPPIVLVNAETPLGTTTFAVVGLSDFEAPCNTLQVVRYGAAPVDLDVMTDPNENALLEVIWGRAELVVSTIEVDAAPVAIECGAGADDNFDYPPKEGGPIDLGQTFTTTEEALEGFLAQAKPGISRSGYTKMLESDGSISFGFDGGSGYATVVSVTAQDGRWVVEAWASAGC
ncbi:hypothetical protein BH23ACT5_BH23ACT5_11080 [soil metagenome]